MAVNPYVNKVQLADGTTVIDISDTTAAAADVASGKYFYTAAGQKTAGTSSGGGGGGIVISDTADAAGGTVRTITAVQISGTKQITQNGTGIDVTEYAAVDVNVQGGSGGEYTRTVIAPQQTVTPNSSRQATLTHSGTFVDGESYIITLDGVEWLSSCETLWTDNYCVGEAQLFLGSGFDTVYPFGGASYQGGMEFVFADTNQHSIKVEHLEFPESGTTLVPKSITANGTYDPADDDADGYSSVTVNVPASQPNLQAKTNISPSTSSQTIQADSGYDGLSSVQINAMPSGTAGTPTATKGTVSNHQVSVTPSVTNTTGYITGSTKTGTAVTVTASELASGNKEITSNGTGIDVVGYSTVSVAVPTGSTKALYKYEGFASRTANSYGSTSATVTVAKAGTYNISYVAIRGSSTGTMGTNLHIGATEKGNQQTFNNGTYGQYVSYSNQSIAANTAVTIYATSGNNSRTIYVGQLIVEEV